MGAQTGGGGVEAALRQVVLHWMLWLARDVFRRKKGRSLKRENKPRKGEGWTHRKHHDPPLPCPPMNGPLEAPIEETEKEKDGLI